MQTDGNGAGWSTSWRRTSSSTTRACMRRSCCGFWPSCSTTCPRSATAKAQAGVLLLRRAHLLFNGAPAALVEKVEQVVRLVRSKGVGVYFVTQNPLDIPEKVLGQLGNRVQHALRAFAARPEGRAVGRRNDARQPEDRHRERDPRARRRRGAGVAARREGRARHHRACLDPAAGVPARADHGRRAGEAHVRIGRGRSIRQDGRSRIRVRAAQGARRRGGCDLPDRCRRARVRGERRRHGRTFGHPVRVDRPRGGRREGMVDALAKSAARTVRQLDRARDHARRAGLAPAGRRRFEAVQV